MAPPPCSPFLRNEARGSPNHSRRSDTDLPQSLRRDISTGQKGKLRNNEHLSNQSSLSRPGEGRHEDMVYTSAHPKTPQCHSEPFGKLRINSAKNLCGRTNQEILRRVAPQNDIQKHGFRMDTNDTRTLPIDGAKMPQRAPTQSRYAGLETTSELHKDPIPCLHCESCFSRIQSCPLWSSFPPGLCL